VAELGLKFRSSEYRIDDEVSRFREMAFFGKRGVFRSQKVGKRESVERVRGKSEGSEGSRE
jgi:hypothetical protein